MFKEAFLNRRCLIPTDGFYEWKRIKEKKIPYRFTTPNEELFAFAGVYSIVDDKISFAILTKEIIKKIKTLDSF